MDIADYLNTLSPAAAMNYYNRLVDGVASLSQLRDRCPYPRDLALTAKGYRYLKVGSYLVFSVVSGGEVQIRRILYGRSNYQALL